jgi:hypothetical protein
MGEFSNLWPNLMTAARNPLSLVALLILSVMSLLLSKSGLNPTWFAVIIMLCSVGVFFVAIYGISAKISSDQAERESKQVARESELRDLASTLGQCIAEGSRPHIANLEVPQERIDAYARLIIYVRGSGQTSNSKFRERASEEIFLYAYTQGRCTKAEIEKSMKGISE